MPTDRLGDVLDAQLAAWRAAGRLKAPEAVVTRIVPAGGPVGPRYVLSDGQPYLRMNANNYLGLAGSPALVAAAEAAARAYGAGPGAVRFISGTFAPHLALERRLAAFHGREAAMLFSSAYAAVLGTLASLISEDTGVLSDALNHNSIINAVRMSRPREKRVFRHLDVVDLAAQLASLKGVCRRMVIVTDGVFSMRGDHAPLQAIVEVAHAHDADFADNVIVVVDDSHGVGAIGERGRGTEELTGNVADVLIATLGKALGVNGGYVAASATVVEYLRQAAPTYVYSNCISPAEAAAAERAVQIVEGAEGLSLLRRLRDNTERFRRGLASLGLETVAGVHPVVPVMVRDTARTAAIVAHLKSNGILATGLTYPVVPQGDDAIRFQVAADHTAADIDAVLAALKSFR